MDKEKATNLLHHFKRNMNFYAKHWLETGNNRSQDLAFYYAEKAYKLDKALNG